MNAPALDDLASCRHHRISIEPAHDGWSLFNPTIAADGGLIGIVRSSNYRIVGGQYVMPDADGNVIRTENILVTFSDDLRVESSRVLSGPEYPHTTYPVAGLEDCRLRITSRGLGVSATVRNVSPFDGRCRIAVADLDRVTATLSGLQVLSGLRGQEHEKNWMPFMGGRGGWLYASHYHGHVVTVDEDQAIPGAWQVVQRSRSPDTSSGHRGGSQLIPFAGGWIGVVHEVSWSDAGRVYEHRFVWFNERLELRRVSPLFAFRERNAIEFAAGIAAHGDDLVVSYGVRDAEAWLCAVPAAAVDKLLA